MNNKSCKVGAGRYRGSKKKRRLEKERAAKKAAAKDLQSLLNPTQQEKEEVKKKLEEARRASAKDKQSVTGEFNDRNNAGINAGKGWLTPGLATLSEVLTIPGRLAAAEHTVSRNNPLYHSNRSGGKKTRKGKRRVSRRHKRRTNKKK